MCDALLGEIRSLEEIEPNCDGQKECCGQGEANVYYDSLGIVQAGVGEIGVGMDAEASFAVVG